jgi:hypothetical protein
VFALSSFALALVRYFQRFDQPIFKRTCAPGQALAASQLTQIRAAGLGGVFEV